MRKLFSVLCLLFVVGRAAAGISYVRIDTASGLALAGVTVNTLTTQYFQVAITDWQAIAPGTLYDNQANVYVLDTTVNDGAVARVSIYHAYITTPSATTVVAYSTTATAFITIAVHSLNGVALTNPIDRKSAFASSVATAAGTPPSVTPSVSGCMIFTAVNARGGGATSGFPTIAGAGGYTQTMFHPFISSQQFASGTAYLIQSTPAPAAQTWNYAASSSSALAQVVIKPDQPPGGRSGMMMWSLRKKR